MNQFDPIKMSLVGGAAGSAIAPGRVPPDPTLGGLLASGVPGKVSVGAKGLAKPISGPVGGKTSGIDIAQMLAGIGGAISPQGSWQQNLAGFVQQQVATQKQGDVMGKLLAGEVLTAEDMRGLVPEQVNAAVTAVAGAKSGKIAAAQNVVKLLKDLQGLGIEGDLYNQVASELGTVMGGPEGAAVTAAAPAVGAAKAPEMVALEKELTSREKIALQGLQGQVVIAAMNNFGDAQALKQQLNLANGLSAVREQQNQLTQMLLTFAAKDQQFANTMAGYQIAAEAMYPSQQDATGARNVTPELMVKRQELLLKMLRGRPGMEKYAEALAPGMLTTVETVDTPKGTSSNDEYFHGLNEERP